MRVIHLPRVSSLKQARQGDSVETQIKRLNEHSISQEDDIVGVYTDAGKSASISDDNIGIRFIDGNFLIKLDLNKRLGLKKALEEIDKDLWDGAKFTKWDRLSRNNLLSKILQIYFERNNKKLIPVDDSNEPLLVDIKGVLNEEEGKKLAGRVRDVRLSRFERGMFPARSPFGYKPIIRDKKVIGFKIDKKKADIVRQAFDYVSSGKTIQETAKVLGMGFQSIKNIIRNRVYCGFVEFEGKTQKGTYEKIIGEEIYWKCQEKI